LTGLALSLFYVVVCVLFLIITLLKYEYEMVPEAGLEPAWSIISEGF